MQYKNIRTGVVIDVTSPIIGKSWVPIDELPPIEEPTITEPIEEPAEEEPVDDFDLTKMTVDELKTFATENDIELSATKKADIIEEIAKAFEM